MKILFLPTYFFPEKITSFYLWENIIETLTNNNYSLEVYVPMPSRGLSKSEQHKFKQKKEENSHGGKLKIYRFQIFSENKNPIQRAFRYILSCIFQFYYGVQAKDVKMVFVTSTPPIQGALAAFIKKTKKIPFVYCLQDVFPDSLVSSGLTTKNSLLWRLGRSLENFTYRNADKIIVISEDFKANLMNKGVPPEKVTVIYNWVDENAVVPITRSKNILFDEFKLSRDYFYIVYAGNLGHAQNLKIILDAAERFKEFNDIHFIIFGTGGLEDHLKLNIEQLKLNNVSLFPIQPPTRVSEVYSLGDVSIISCKTGFGKIAFPSKTWNIMSAGTAVLASFDENTELQFIIENNELGLFTQSENVDEFVMAIKHFYNNKDFCKKCGENGRKYILNNLTREIGTQKYLEVFNKLITNE